MIDFRSLLDGAGIDATSVIVIRHTAREPRLQRVLPWLVEERPALFLAYQRIQWRNGERAMRKASVLASFIGLASGEAVFAGLWRIGDHATLDETGYRAFPGNAELFAYGMQSDRTAEAILAFDLEPLEALIESVGKLTVGWSPGQTWARWADRNRFPIIEFARDSRFVKAMPSWRDLTLTMDELRMLPRRWADELCRWRGVYYIYDTQRRAGYVGSASGEENIGGRWRGYAATGHGGNVELRGSDRDALRFSVLQVTEHDLPIADVVRLEATWKERLFTRSHGLNRN